MDDSDFQQLQLQALICPQQSRWPKPDVQVSLSGDAPSVSGLHWEKLHAAADEPRNHLAKAWAGMDAIDADRDLSAEGKDRKKTKLASAAIAALEQSKTLAEAKDSVDRQMSKWAEQTGLAVTPPATVAEAVVHSEIRAHLAAMKENKMGFLAKHAADGQVAAAVLGAPSFLSGLSDEEFSFFRTRVEEHVAPGVVKARTETLKALEHAEQGRRTALDKIGERAGLTKGADGTWRDPSMSEAA